jgi:hypothetical protein
MDETVLSGVVIPESAGLIVPVDNLVAQGFTVLGRMVPAEK